MKGDSRQALAASAPNAPSGAGGGSVDVYEETDPDHYKSGGKVASGPSARTALLVPELQRYFVAVPQHKNADAEFWFTRCCRWCAVATGAGAYEATMPIYFGVVVGGSDVVFSKNTATEIQFAPNGTPENNA
jgi:hypothetical protein